MGIKYYEQERVFKLDTKASSYLIGIVDEENFVGHIYYGKKIEDYNLQYLLRIEEAPFVPSTTIETDFLFMIVFLRNILHMESETLEKIAFR